MDEDIIPALELEMVNLLAQEYVIPDCVVSRAKQTSQPVSTFVGISSKPDDKSMERSCQQFSEGRSCTLVEGRMSMYVDGVSDGWASDLMGAIERGMQNNTFIGAHSSISKIVLVCSDLDPCNFDPLSPTSSPISSSDPPSGDGGPPAVGGGMMALYVLAGVGSLISFAAVGRFARRKRILSAVSDREESDFEESVSSGVSIGSIKDLGDFEHSSPHDLDTVRVSNRVLADDMLVNVDLESFDSNDDEDDGCFDFFDLILEGSSPNDTQVRGRGIPQAEVRRDDDVSEMSI